MVSRAFLDLGVAPNDSGKLKIVLIPFILILLALIIYSIYFICRTTYKRVWLFVLTLSGSRSASLNAAGFCLSKAIRYY